MNKKSRFKNLLFSVLDNYSDLKYLKFVFGKKS